MTAHNEGEEVQRTLHSIRENTEPPYEIILVDEASTDGSCDHVQAADLRLIRHEDRRGVAPSRNEASRAARGDVFVYLDAHQRLSPRCLNECAEAARKYRAIVWPDVRGLTDRNWTGHGATMQLCDKRGYFSARWNRQQPRDKISRCTTLCVPGYMMTREVYQQVQWISQLRGWGASEAAITVKAFFLDIDILHVCGPLARHYFRPQGSFPYEVSWESVWRNHAIIARVCFDDRAWFEHWLPNVFEKFMTDSLRSDLASAELLAERDAFLAKKQRPDREFWRGVLHTDEPRCLRP